MSVYFTVAHWLIYLFLFLNKLLCICKHICFLAFFLSIFFVCYSICHCLLITFGEVSNSFPLTKMAVTFVISFYIFDFSLHRQPKYSSHIEREREREPISDSYTFIHAMLMINLRVVRFSSARFRYIIFRHPSKNMFAV